MYLLHKVFFFVKSSCENYQIWAIARVIITNSDKNQSICSNKILKFELLKFSKSEKFTDK